MIQAMAPSAPRKWAAQAWGGVRLAARCSLGRGVAGVVRPWPPEQDCFFIHGVGPSYADWTASSSEPAPTEALVCQAAWCWVLLAGRTGLLSRRPCYGCERTARVRADWRSLWHGLHFIALNTRRLVASTPVFEKSALSSLSCDFCPS